MSRLTHGCFFFLRKLIFLVLNRGLIFVPSDSSLRRSNFHSASFQPSATPPLVNRKQRPYARSESSTSIRHHIADLDIEWLLEDGGDFDLVDGIYVSGRVLARA